MKKIIVLIFSALALGFAATAQENNEAENLPEECKALTKEQRKDPNGACYATMKREGGSRETEGVVEYVTASVKSSVNFANAASPALTANTNYNLNRIDGSKDAVVGGAPVDPSAIAAPAADASTKKDGKQ